MKKMLWVKDRDQTWQEIRDIAPTLATSLTRIELPKVRSSREFRVRFKYKYLKFCSVQVTGPVLQELLGSWTQLETLHATFVSAPFDVTDLSKLKELKEVKLKASAGSNIQVQNYRTPLGSFL